MSGDPQQGPSSLTRSQLQEGSETPSEIANILQFLISSGQVQILGGNEHVCTAIEHPPAAGSNLENFHKSEICLLTKKACGSLNENPKGWSIPKLINQRELGFRSARGFTSREICKISLAKLPSDRRQVDYYENKAFCAVYSEDGNRLVTACQDRQIRLYSTLGKYYRQVGEIQGRDVGWSILDLAFSPDGKHIAYSSWSNSLHFVELDGDLSTHTSLPLCPDERRFCVFNLIFSSSGDELLCGANDGNLYIYNLHSNNRVLRVKAHNDDTNAVTFADNASQIIYSGGDDGFCKVWDRRTLNESYPKPVGILAGHMDGITYIDSRGDARYLISNSKDQTIKLWDIRHFSPDIGQENTRRVVATHKWDYRWQRAPKKLTNRKTNMKGDTSVATYRGHSVLQTLIRCKFSPAFTTGQRYIYTGCAFGRIVVYDMLTGEIVHNYEGHASCVRDVSWHPYRPEMVSASWDFSVACWGFFGNPKKKEVIASWLVPEVQPVRRSERLRMPCQRDGVSN